MTLAVANLAIAYHRTWLLLKRCFLKDATLTDDKARSLFALKLISLPFKLALLAVYLVPSEHAKWKQWSRRREMTAFIGE